MNTLVRSYTVFLLSMLLLCPYVGFTAEPPVGTASFAIVKSGKSKFKPTNYSTFLTFNVENIQFHRSDPFFHYQNLAYGLKIGTMRNTGWYLSVMSNFNFNGLFKSVDANAINPAVNSTKSYVEGLFGLTFREFKPTSFHLGVGYHYMTTNFMDKTGVWGHLSGEEAHGPMAAAGFMFHMSGFVLSAEAVANYNLKAPHFKDGLGVGFKLGIGFCLEHKKNSAKKTKKKVSDKMSASEFHFAPSTAGPDEYDVLFRHSYTKPKPEFLALIEADTLLSKLPQPEQFKVNLQEEVLTEDNPANVTEVVTPVANQSDSNVSEREELKVSKSEPVNIAKTEVPADLQPEKQQEKKPEKAVLDSLIMSEPQSQKVSEVQSSKVSEPQQNIPVEKENVSEPFVMPSAPVPPCKELTVKDVDGNTYHTLGIGSQCWLRENMRTTRFSNGDTILPSLSFDFQNATRYCPDGDSSNVEEYGYLYNWNTVSHQIATNGGKHLQGVCPNGWHIPDMTEWEELFGFLAGQSAMKCQGDSQYVAKALASKTGWAVSEMDCAIGNQLTSNNVSGFHALPAGMFFGKFDFFGKVARFWSSSVSHAQGKSDVYMSWDEAIVKKSDQEPAVVGFSVRCLKN